MAEKLKADKSYVQKVAEQKSKRFEEYYLWIEQHMPSRFFEEIDKDTIVLITHNLMCFDVQNYFSRIHLKSRSIILCLDSPDADLKILKYYQIHGIKNYRTFISDKTPSFPGLKSSLRIAVVDFTKFNEDQETAEELFPLEKQSELLKELQTFIPEINKEKFKQLLEEMNSKFLYSLTKKQLVTALHMFFRARTRDNCQYEVEYHKNWEEKNGKPSIEIVFAWKNVPKHNFLYRLAKVVHRHNLKMTRVNASYVNAYSKQSILVMSLALHGSQGKAAWEETDIDDFLKELVTLKYFDGLEIIESAFVDSNLVKGNIGNFIKTMVYFVHQVLVHADANMYSIGHIEEALCRHPELTVQLTQAFEAKFHPKKHDIQKYETIKHQFLDLVNRLDTGHEVNDTRRKNILKQALNFIQFTLKTNFHRNNKTAFSFRLDPTYLEEVPYDKKDKFPELPYAIFFMKGMYFIGFHIRFKDLSRGGLRTVFPQKMEQMLVERNHVFSECYNLAYTQQKKNKDIPEGGAKGVIFLEPYDRLLSEEQIYQKELEEAGIRKEEVLKKIKSFQNEQKLEYLYQTQRSYIESFLTLINCEEDGTLKAKDIIDYWEKPEYIYLGPDENMHNEMIVWISSYSKYHHYKPGGSFITSKPGAGINHKEFGVTSFGVNVYMEEVLKYLGIDPYKDPFTVKMSGGPDGDVAGNQIYNLFQYYPKTAKLLTLIDVSGTLYDPQGVDLPTMVQLFKEAKPLRFYSPEKLSEGGFLLDLHSKREQTTYTQQTLCWRKQNGKLIEDWISGNEMNYLLRNTVHQTVVDIFIPGGGRPRTLNDTNFKEFLDPTGKPTARAIVEGANLYLTPWARRSFEKLGLIIIKDSSANKGGVICSSFEVLAGLILSEDEFIAQKPVLMREILEIIRSRAKDEAELMLKTHRETKAFLTDISELISEHINTFTYQLLEYLQNQTLSNNPKDPLIRCLLEYCPPSLRNHYSQRILDNVPDIHKKAIIACYIASKIVYKRGLDWSPTIVDILPLIAKDPTILT